MALKTRFGDEIELIRLATIEDVKKYENRKVDKDDRERTRDGWRAIARYAKVESGVGANRREILVDAGYLRATDGWAEILAAFEALQKKDV